MEKKEYSLEIGGKTLTAQFTDLADQTNGSVILKYGDTTVLATAVMSEHEREGLNYFPLSVEFEEKFYAAGAILGSRFMRREGKPSDEAVLSGRVIDRTIRPLFNHHLRREMQVVVTVLSINEDDPDILAINAASLALLTSDIPWEGPVSAVRLGKHKENNDFVVNPQYSYRDDENSEIDMIICGKDGNINMIEVGSLESSDEVIIEAFEEASKQIEMLQDFQKKIAKEIGKEKQVIETLSPSEQLISLFEENIAPKMKESVFSGSGKGKINDLHTEWKKMAKESLSEEDKSLADLYYEDKVDELIHKEAVENDKRADGRKMDEVRELLAQAGGISPMIHGSGIFYRGGTHVFSALTLGGPQDSQIIDSIETQNSTKSFMHHYNFPPYSVGETGRVGGFNRRMIGHGALAEKALLAVIPKKEEFPYTIRIVSESLASNGSTSMASVCASTIALMDGGIPIKNPVAGIAMGLMMESPDKYKVLTDIQGPEDHHGDMDFKVAGTRDGVTAIQMDVKVDGIPIKILKEALGKAGVARMQILDTIEKEIQKPRENISARAPEIVTLTIKPDQIGLVIGPGGKTINEMKDRTGVDEITLEDDGSVFITGRNGTAEMAKKEVEELTHEYKVGEEFNGKVANITDFGAFVTIGKNTDGLVHISEIAPFRVEKVGDILSEGEEVPVVIKEIDERHRIGLSIKDRDPEFAKKKGVEPPSKTQNK